MRRPNDTEEFIAMVNEDLEKVNRIVERINPDKGIDDDKARRVLSNLDDAIDDLVSLYGIQQLF